MIVGSLALRRGLGAAALLAALLPLAARAKPTITVLHSFPSSDVGPKGFGLARDGNFYGTTSATQSAPGSVFRFTQGGVFQTLATFDFPVDGGPFGAPFLAADGNLYGIAFDGGSGGVGTVYKIDPANTLSVFHTFAGVDGIFPLGLVPFKDGNFYGTTFQGGTASFGNVYRLTPGGAIANLVSCTLKTCLNPDAPVLGSDGNVYGSSEGDKAGFRNSGMVYEIAPQFKVLADFNGTAASGPLGVTQGKDGNLYGLAEDFVAHTQEFFRVGTHGGLTLIRHLAIESPFGRLVLGADGNFYLTQFGDIHHPGAILRLTPAGDLRTLASFDGKNGVEPDSLVSGNDGNLYGTTETGGPAGGGVIFKATIR